MTAHKPYLRKQEWLLTKSVHWVYNQEYRSGLFKHWSSLRDRKVPPTMLLCTECAHSSVWPSSVHQLVLQEWCSLNWNKTHYNSSHFCTHVEQLPPTAWVDCMFNKTFTWYSWFTEHHRLCCSRDLTQVGVDEDGLRSGDAGHGLQVSVMPAVSLHVVLRHEGFALLCLPNYPDHLHFTFHLHTCMVTVHLGRPEEAAMLTNVTMADWKLWSQFPLKGEFTQQLSIHPHADGNLS